MMPELEPPPPPPPAQHPVTRPARRRPVLPLLMGAAALGASFAHPPITATTWTGQIQVPAPPRYYPPGDCRICGKRNVRAGRERGDYRCGACIQEGRE